MYIIEKIFLFFKKLLHKENNIKMLEAPQAGVQDKNQFNFIESLKIAKAEGKKKRIETLIFDGDGLGIQTKAES